MPFLYAIGALGTAVLILFIINYTDKLENCEKERHTKEMTKVIVCEKCGAPLKSNICEFCGAKYNFTDINFSQDEQK